MVETVVCLGRMKGILKKGGSSDQKSPKQLAFDEANLCDNERARPENGYQHIDEPKTPFAKESSENDEGDMEDEEDERIHHVLQKYGAFDVVALLSLLWCCSRFSSFSLEQRKKPRRWRRRAISRPREGSITGSKRAMLSERRKRRKRFEKRRYMMRLRFRRGDRSK